MDTDHYYNPLALDEQVIAEKLGIYDYVNKPDTDVNVNLKIALLQEELANSKKTIDSLRKKQPPTRRETFVSGGADGGSCGCGEGFKGTVAENASKKTSCSCQEWSIDSILGNKRILTFIIIILVVFCVFQYLSYRSENREIFDMLKEFLKKTPSGTPAANAV